MKKVIGLLAAVAFTASTAIAQGRGEPHPAPHAPPRPEVGGGHIPPRGPANENRLRYELADLQNGFSPDPNRFYEFNYRPTLRAMVAVVIRTEGPIFLELLLTRIARAHGFGRIGGTIRETIVGAIDPIFATSGHGGMKVLWPQGSIKESTPFRYSAAAVRSLWDIPDV